MRFHVRADRLPNETEEQTHRLYEAMGRFYAGIPAGVTLEGDWVRADGRGSFSVLDVPDRATLYQVLAPFSGLVALEVVEVRAAVAPPLLTVH